MKKIFIEAHKMTKEMVEEYGVDYQAQFGLCVSYLLEEEKAQNIEIKSIKDIEKLIKTNMDNVKTERNFEITDFRMKEWKNYGKHRVYIEIQLDYQRKFEGHLEVLENETKFYVTNWGSRRYNEDTIEEIKRTIADTKEDIVKVA